MSDEFLITKPVAKLVYDGGERVRIPSEMGTPLPSQMQGSPLEQLCELAGRICYDSLGQGRPSFDNFTDAGKLVQGYHTHIHEVRHFSVYRHAWFHLAISGMALSDLNTLSNRPGVRVLKIEKPMGGEMQAQLSLNLEAVFRWPSISERRNGVGTRFGTCGNGWLRGPLSRVAPNLVRFLQEGDVEFSPALVDANSFEDRWVSMYLSGSRGFSHEMVRHSYQCAPSQRSTRYCDEHESAWVHHPLVQQFLADESVSSEEQLDLMRTIDEAVVRAREAYKATNDVIYRYLEKRGYDKASCRKQARGAARGYLGNALETAMIFSASVNQWKEILDQRGGAAADAEIRCLAVEALKQLKLSRYVGAFEGYAISEVKGLPCVVKEPT